MGISLKDIAEKIVLIAQTNVNIDIRYNNTDTSHYVPDITLCEKDLGLKISYNIEDTIRRSIAWFKLSQ